MKRSNDSLDQPIGEARLKEVRAEVNRILEKGGARVHDQRHISSVVSFDEVTTEMRSAVIAKGILARMRKQKLIREVRDELMAGGISHIVLGAIGGKVAELDIGQKDIQDYHLNRGIEATKLCSCKMGGRSFLKDLFEGRREYLTDKLTEANCRELAQLDHVVVENFGQHYSGCAHLLFYCVGEIEVVRNIIETQTRSYVQAKARRRKGDKEVVHFFDHLPGFLSVVGDVTHYLVQNSQHGNEIYQRTRNFLSEFFQDERITTLRKVPMPDGVNLFDLFREWFEANDQNHPNRESSCPWVVSNFSKTPYDRKSIGCLINREVPRGGLARVLLELNDHDHFKFLRQATPLLEQYYRTVKSQGKVDKIGGQITDLISRFKLPIDRRLELGEKVEQLERRVGEIKDPLDRFDEGGGPLVEPRKIILRAISPTAIAGSPDLQGEWDDILQKLMSPQDKKKNDLVV